MNRARAGVALALLLRALPARADPDDGASGADDAPATRRAPDPPRDPATLPGFMRQKRRMRDEDLEDKVEGGYVTGLPLVNGDPDTGLGFGARALYFANGPRADRMFEYTPYRHRVFGQAFFTTNGYQHHTVDYDAPYLLDEPLRLRASVTFEKNVAANYFGVGPRSLDRLAFPGSERRYGSLGEYTEALRQARPDGTAYTRYNQYIVERPTLAATLERDLFGGVVRGLLGFTASYVGVRQWTGREVSATDPTTGEDAAARQATTRLDEDCARGLVKGCGGGFNNALKLGVAFDTRDFEPDPNAGFFVDLTTELAGRPLGSDFDWARVTFSPRAYWSPAPKLADVVVAGRLVASAQTRDVPFFTMPELSFTDVNARGLGGLRTIRGFKQSRFVGRAVTLANVEVRWTFWQLAAARNQRFAFILAPFFDVGRVFDTLDDFELRRFRNGQGAGLRVAWNQATIVALDFGMSREATALYVDFGHPF
ncbi:MAG: BamA/TamA family outer membrane protein [Labilithrix sp.]|nr:BamA/TamA family outer membrane protein [Labilithrix sp.]